MYELKVVVEGTHKNCTTYTFVMMIINCAATEAVCDTYSSGGGGIACRSVSATRPTHRTMVHRFDIRRVYNYDNGGPRLPFTAPDSVRRRVYIIITIIWSFIFFFFTPRRRQYIYYYYYYY